METREIKPFNGARQAHLILPLDYLGKLVKIRFVSDDHVMFKIPSEFGNGAHCLFHKSFIGEQVEVFVNGKTE